VERHRNASKDDGFIPIGRVRGTLLRIWGPADSWDNPLAGTRYDPTLQAQRQHDSLEYRRWRWDRRRQKWDQRLHGSPVAGRPPAPEHPDE